jgi:ankyrin repeat protein
LDDRFLIDLFLPRFQLKCFGEHADLSWVLPNFRERGDTALHVAIAQEDNSSLQLIEFLIQNCKHLNLQNRDGNTALHLGVLTDQKEALKLLLKAQADPNIINSSNKSSFDLAHDLNRTSLMHLVSATLIREVIIVYFNLY